MTRAFRFDRIIRLLVGPVSVLMMAWLLAGCAAEEGGDGLAAVAANATAENSETQVGSVETAASGVTADSVLFGQSAAFGGPARELGFNMRLGIEAAFHEANQQGGVHGRRLLLVTKDDAYEPEAAIANTHQLIEEEGVFALIGAVGTPTSRSAVPVASKLDFPHFKRRKRGNRQVGGTERLGVPAYRGRQPTLKNPPTPATGGVAPGQWRPRRSATACRTRPLGAGSWGAVFATRGRPGWSRRRFPAGRAWCGRWPGRTTGVGFPRPGGSAPPER